MWVALVLLDSSATLTSTREDAEHHSSTNSHTFCCQTIASRLPRKKEKHEKRQYRIGSNPKYYDERSPGTSHLKPKKDKIPHLRRRQGQVDKTDVEIVVPYFLLETAGKVPRKVCAAADEYLRRQYKAGADVAPVALSFPTEGEGQFQKQLASSLRRPGGGQTRLTHLNIGEFYDDSVT